jgi:hypothetical protein
MKVGRNWILAALIISWLVPPSRAAVGGKIGLVLEWQLENGQAGKKDFGAIEVAKVAGKGLWIAFQQEKGQCFPGIYLNDSLVLASAPIEQMSLLELVTTYQGSQESVACRSVLFGKNRPVGSKMGTAENVYHLLVLDGFVQDEGLASKLKDLSLPDPKWEGPFGRTHRLAENYAAQSDAKVREYARTFGVVVNYDLPRLILAAEEWMDLPKEVQEKKKSGGLFGGALDSIGDEIAGETKVVQTKIPIYSLDVLLDEVRAEGKYPVGFQAARSIYADILEGKVIYEATGGKRRVLTATTVFSQMQKNKAAGKSDSNTVTIDAESTAMLEECERLWPAAKEQITAFLKEHTDWRVIIPEKPVTFYENDKPIYAMYAWFQVHPASGRMIGVLPNGTRGAFSDEMAKLEETLIEKAKEKVGASGGPVKVLFSQVAGMYVSSAGILDAVGLTICDPNLANLGDEEWKKFLANHSLDFCQQFLEDNADTYDSYAARLGFWQGATVIVSELGGKEAARECAQRALADAANKAANDARKYFEDKVKELTDASQEGLREAFDEAMEKHAPEVKRFVEGVEALNDHFDKAVDTYKTLEDYKDRANALWDEWKAAKGR